MLNSVYNFKDSEESEGSRGTVLLLPWSAKAGTAGNYVMLNDSEESWEKILRCAQDDNSGVQYDNSGV